MLALATEHYQTHSESNVNIQINTVLTRLDMLHDEHFVKIHFEGYISCVNFVYAVQGKRELRGQGAWAFKGAAA